MQWLRCRNDLLKNRAKSTPFLPLSHKCIRTSTRMTLQHLFCSFAQRRCWSQVYALMCVEQRPFKLPCIEMPWVQILHDTH